MIAERAERGRQLYLRSRQLIIKTGPDSYAVPASSEANGSYTVRYGSYVEDCECTDFQVNRGELSCKHISAVAFLHATYRRQTPCGCVNGTHYIGYTAIDDDGEEVEAFHAYRCRRCERSQGREESGWTKRTWPRWRRRSRLPTR